MQAARQRATRTAVVAGWRRNRDLLDNAGSLLATTGLTSLLGFVYWTVAARVFSQRSVGYGSALVSAMTLLGTIGMFGLGTLLIGELPQRRGTRAGLVSAALLACGLGSLLLGLGFAVAAPHVSSHFAMLSTPGRVALFTLGVAVTAVTMVFDQATIGLLRGGLQLWRNIAFSVAKLLTVAAAAVTLHDALGVGITLSWVAGMTLSLVAIAVWLRLHGTRLLPRPHWGILRSLGRTAMAHNWLNISLAVPFSVLPVLVTVIVSPSANAAYYMASMLCAFLFVVPVHLSTVLFAVVAADPQVVAQKLRVALRLSFLIGLPGMIVLAAGANLLLGLFGSGYASAATVPMILMALGYPFTVPKALYIAVCRASGRIARAAAVLTTFSAMELAAAAAGAVSKGLVGLALALGAVRLIEALLVTPSVVSAARGRGRHRRAELEDTAAEAGAGALQPLPLSADRSGSLAAAGGGHQPQEQWPQRHWPEGQRPRRGGQAGADLPAVRRERAHQALRDQRYREMQEAGLAALVSMAGFVPATGPLPVITAGLPGQARMQAREDQPDDAAGQPQPGDRRPPAGGEPPGRRAARDEPPGRGD